MERQAYAAYLKGYSCVFCEGATMEECLGFAIGQYARSIEDPLLSFAGFKQRLNLYLEDNQ